MPIWTHVNSAFIESVLTCSAAWRFPTYARTFLRGEAEGTGCWPAPPLAEAGLLETLLRPLLPATFIEWRYFSVLASAFHGIVGMALFNPFNRFDHIAESGLLLIVAGVFDAPRSAARLQEQIVAGELRQLCWMHLFPTHCLDFAATGTTRLRAVHNGVRLHIEQPAAQQSTIKLSSDAGLELALSHTGLDNTAIAPCFAEDLARTPGAHWAVYNPSPIAKTSGEMRFSRQFFDHIADDGLPGSPSSVSAALRRAAAAGSYQVRWDDADGYYEHSFGVNPLPLHGWDFLFVPDAACKQGLVLQTYLGSRVLRYVEVLWQEAGTQRYTRFTAGQLQLSWREVYTDPAIQAKLPRKRIITARKPGLILEVENTITHQIPFLRPEKLSVRFFFISEQIGFCTWRLTDEQGRVLAAASEQPAGGEVAYGRLVLARS